MSDSLPHAPAPHRLRAIVGEFIPTIIVLLLLTAARSSFANHYVVPSGSMEHALMPGDRVIVDMSAYGVRVPFTDTVVVTGDQPARGEVVVFDSPVDGTRLIKRVVAIAGDRVSLRRGRLTVNGESLATGYMSDIERIGTREVRLNLAHGGGPDIEDQVIPEGKVLVLGDHRGNSQDGRMYGLVAADTLYARALAVYWRSGYGLVWKRL